MTAERRLERLEKKSGACSRRLGFGLGRTLRVVDWSSSLGKH